MRSGNSTGRVVGLLVFIHLVTGLTLPYILMQSLTAPPVGFLDSAAGIASQVRVSVTLLFIGGLATIAIAVASWPVFRKGSYAMGQWLLALAVGNFALQVVENQHWLSMLFLSQQYQLASPPEASVLQVMAPMVRSAWKWAHYTHLLVVVGWMLLFFSMLWRQALVSRALAVVGVVTTLMQLGGITLPVLLDYSVPFRMELYGMPLGVVYLVLALWLLIRGFEESTESSHQDAA